MSCCSTDLSLNADEKTNLKLTPAVATLAVFSIILLVLAAYFLYQWRHVMYEFTYIIFSFTSFCIIKCLVLLAVRKSLTQ